MRVTKNHVLSMLEIPANPIEELVNETPIEDLVIGEVTSELNISINNNEVEGCDNEEETPDNNEDNEEETDLNKTPNNNEDITALENSVDEDWTMEKDKDTSHPSSPPDLIKRKPQLHPKTRSTKTSMTTNVQKKENCEKCGKILNIKSMKAHLRLHEKKELLALDQEKLPSQTKKKKRTLVPVSSDCQPLAKKNKRQQNVL